MGMDEKSSDQTPQADCCLENAQPDCCQPTVGNASECSAVKKRPWVKILVFILVMLAAAGVGAYSILTRTGNAEIEPPTVNRGSPAKSAVNPTQPCCPSQDSAPVMPTPACENECDRPCCGGE